MFPTKRIQNINEILICILIEIDQFMCHGHVVFHWDHLIGFSRCIIQVTIKYCLFMDMWDFMSLICHFLIQFLTCSPMVTSPSTHNMLFSVTCYLELHNSISINCIHVSYFTNKCQIGYLDTIEHQQLHFIKNYVNNRKIEHHVTPK